MSAEIDAPREGRAATRAAWLVRQLKDAPDGVRIDAFVTGARSSTSELLRVVRENPGVLVGDAKREFRMFRVTAASPLGPKRGTGRGGFIDSVLAAVDGFYASILQRLRPWTAKAPQLPKGGRMASEEAGIDVTPPTNDLLGPVVAAETADAALPNTDAPDVFVEGAERAAAKSTEEPRTGEEAEPLAPKDDGRSGRLPRSWCGTRPRSAWSTSAASAKSRARPQATTKSFGGPPGQIAASGCKSPLSNAA